MLYPVCARRGARANLWCVTQIALALHVRTSRTFIHVRVQQNIRPRNKLHIIIIAFIYHYYRGSIINHYAYRWLVLRTGMYHSTVQVAY